MEAVPRMPMIWLDLKEAGDFHFQSAVKKFVLKNYGENPEAYNEELKKLELLRQNAIRVARDFEGCSVLRKYLGQQQKFGERVAYFQSALDKLNEAIKLAKGQPDTVQDALRFAMDVIGGKYNSTKVDAAEGRRPQALRLIEQDPYEHPERLQQLQQELEAFRGQLGDAGALDAIWRELQEAQEHDARGRSIAIARCYSLKNRHQDVMPYDSNRVVLRSGKDDYINASCVEGLSPYCPPLVATQAPLPGTAADFWLMVHEQKVSVIVMLVSEAEMEKQKVARYFPTERGQPMVHGALSVALSSIRTTETHVERVLSLQFRDQSLKRSLVHLHFPAQPTDDPLSLLDPLWTLNKT